MIFLSRFSKIDQDGLSIKNMQDGLSIKNKQDWPRWSIFQEKARLTKMVYLSRLNKIDQDDYSWVILGMISDIS